MKLVNWNIQWMNDWFVGGTEVGFRTDNPGRGITDVNDLAQRVARVIRNMDPDVLTIEEGPSDIREMQLFVNEYLKTSGNKPLYDVIGSGDGGSQKLYALIKRNGEFRNYKIADDPPTVALGDEWETDVDGDLTLNAYHFTRRPLVLDGQVSSTGEPVRLVVLHTKSKYVHNGESLWNNPSKRSTFVKEALQNRRRISAEAMRTREYLDRLLAINPTARIVVTGDFNDGPGTDYFEKRYLTHNVTDILMGSTYFPEGMFEHAFLKRVPAQDRFTAIFSDFVDNIEERQILLDHIIVSPTLAPAIRQAGIAHQEFDQAINTHATGRQRYPSDHRPVFVEV